MIENGCTAFVCVCVCMRLRARRLQRTQTQREALFTFFNHISRRIKFALMNLSTSLTSVVAAQYTTTRYQHTTSYLTQCGFLASPGSRWNGKRPLAACGYLWRITCILIFEHQLEPQKKLSAKRETRTTTNTDEADAAVKWLFFGIRTFSGIHPYRTHHCWLQTLIIYAITTLS